MTEKRFKLRLSKLGNGMITDTQKKEDLYFDKEFLDVTLPKTNEWLNELAEENNQLKQQLKSIEDSFKFSCNENPVEFNKDEIKVEDTHTEITLNDGKLCISVFIPQLNEYVKFFYLVTVEEKWREFINYESDVE